MTDTAVFDFDGTLLPGDSLLPFLALVAGRRALVGALVRRGPRIAAAMAGMSDRGEAKRRLLTDLVGGRAVADVEEAARRFSAALVGRLRPDVLARLRWHQSAGHRTVIVSASPGVYVRPVGAALGVDGVMATELVIGDGRFTGSIDGRNCRGAEKLDRLRAWLGSREQGRLWVYGDSAGDRELLAAADIAQRVTKRAIPELPAGGGR